MFQLLLLLLLHCSFCLHNNSYSRLQLYTPPLWQFLFFDCVFLTVSLFFIKATKN